MYSLNDAWFSDRISLPTLPPGEQRVVLQATSDEGALDLCPPPPSPPTALRRRPSRSPSPAPTATVTATLAWLSVLLACVRLSVIRRGAGWRSGWLVCLLLAAPQHCQPYQPCQPYLPGTVLSATLAQAWAAPRDPRMLHKPAVNVSLLRNRIDPMPEAVRGVPPSAHVARVAGTLVRGESQLKLNLAALEAPAHVYTGQYSVVQQLVNKEMVGRGVQKLKRRRKSYCFELSPKGLGE